MAQPASSPMWHPTGERRWMIVRRRDEYRTLQSQREEIDMDTGNRRWVSIPHWKRPRTTTTGFRTVLEHEVTEPGEGEVGEVLPWSHRPPTAALMDERDWLPLWLAPGPRSGR
jgi:hypothetical protein